MTIRPLEGSWSGPQRLWTGASLPPDQTVALQGCQPEDLLSGHCGAADWAPKSNQSPRLGRLRGAQQLQEPAKDLDHVRPQLPLPALGKVGEKGEVFQLTPFEKCLRGDREGT